jgi:nucleoside-diphosphate-sugar epimerase
MENSKILITGATGYIGKHLVQGARERNLEVIALARRRYQRFENEGIMTFEYDLRAQPPEEAFRDVNVVIHLAAITENTDLETREIELSAAKNLLKMNRRAGVSNFIFVSSQSASKDAFTQYGQTKWLIEEEVKREGGLVVRPGLVYGGRKEEALFGTLCRLVEAFKVLPALFPAPRVQPIHVEDLCEALLTLAIRDHNPLDIYCVAQRNDMSITRFLKILAWERYHRHLWTIPLPLFLLRWFAHIKKRIQIFPEIKLDRINGMLTLPKMNTRESLKCLNLEPRNLSTGLSSESNRRRILDEGNAFIRYLLGLPSGSFILRRYVRAIQALRGGEPLGLRPFFLQFPAMLRLIDPKRPVWVLKKTDRDELAWHMNTTIALMEASPENVSLFSLMKPMGISVAAFALLIYLIMESTFISLAMVWRVSERMGFSKFSRVKDEF